ncbi:hypothetical protein Tco_0135490, partial [Tanacetum coccineum]
DSEGDILYFEQLLNEDTSFDVSQALLPKESSSLVLPLSDPKQICLRDVERFDPFFSLTQSGGEMRVMETFSFSSHHMSSPRPATYSPKEDFPDCDDSRAHVFVLRSLELHILSFILGIQYPNLID